MHEKHIDHRCSSQSKGGGKQTIKDTCSKKLAEVGRVCTSEGLGARRVSWCIDGAITLQEGHTETKPSRVLARYTGLRPYTSASGIQMKGATPLSAITTVV